MARLHMCTNSVVIQSGVGRHIHSNTVLLTFHRGREASSGTSPGVLHSAQDDPVLHQCVSVGEE